MIASEIISATRRNVETLIKWFVQHKCMDKWVCVYGIEGMADLSVTFFREEHEWAKKEFGVHDWKPKRDLGHLNFSKTVDGIEVCLHHYGLEAPDAPTHVTLSLAASTFAQVPAV